jgi:hypothetical protein
VPAAGGSLSHRLIIELAHHPMPRRRYNRDHYYYFLYFSMLQILHDKFLNYTGGLGIAA